MYLLKVQLKDIVIGREDREVTERTVQEFHFPCHVKE